MKLRRLRRLQSLFFVTVVLILPGCGGGASSSNGSTTASGGSGNSQPGFGHVFLLLEENHSYSDVIGSSSMPYFNSLASQYGLAAQYFANTHPSIGNYLMLTTGEVETNDDAFSGVVSDDNIVRELSNAGKTWKCYAESLPVAGYTGNDQYPYFKHHNPFAYLSDVVNDSSQAANMVPFTQLSSDLANHALPNFSFIVPNALDDAHDGTLEQADAWLQQNIQPLVASPQFQSDGLLIITFDEAEDSDTAHGGGHVATIIVSARGKPAYQSQALYQHQSVLRLILSSLGVSAFPGEAASAPSMQEFLQN